MKLFLGQPKFYHNKNQQNHLSLIHHFFHTSLLIIIFKNTIQSYIYLFQLKRQQNIFNFNLFSHNKNHLVTIYNELKLIPQVYTVYNNKKKIIIYSRTQAS